ncbi:Programmed cell death protein 2-like protein [Drosera capensis]
MEDLSDPIMPPFVSKAGGVPEWLEPINLPTGSSCLCDFCGEPVQFVLQDYLDNAESESSYHRAVYVFTCQSMACLLKHQQKQGDNHLEKTSLRSVKVFRCQLPRINPFYLSDAINKLPSARGVALCCWSGTWKGDKLCSGCKIIRYCSKVHQAMHWRSGHKGECKRLTNSDMPRKAASNTLWPEYVLSFDSECKAEAEQSTDHGNVSLLGAGDEFDGMVNSSMHNFEGHDDESKKPVSPRILIKCPKGNGKPLWPRLSDRPTKSDIPGCHHCGGPLRFEFQFMPQLLYYFHVENEADSLDWATIAVYTCDASCDKTNVVYKEEFAWVQLQ